VPEAVLDCAVRLGARPDDVPPRHLRCDAWRRDALQRVASRNLPCGVLRCNVIVHRAIPTGYVRCRPALDPSRVA
jgi:hypothetical protein